MAKKQKKLGAAGPASHWLDIPVGKRAELKQYIKEAFRGHTNRDGLAVPGIRRIYSGLEAGAGFDLRHIERWSKAKLNRAREAIQSINTLTSRPFQVLIPRSAKQRKAAQSFTGQSGRNQKEFIVQIQSPKTDIATFRKGKVAIERTLKGGEAKTIKQRFLFRDYLKPGEPMPILFRQMYITTERMLPDMPDMYHGREVFYTLTTAQYGPIGNMYAKSRIMDALTYYHETYDSKTGHKHFAEAVVGFTMVGSWVKAREYAIQSDARKIRARKRKQLNFTGPSKRCPVVNKKGKQCVRYRGHTGAHRFS